MRELRPYQADGIEHLRQTVHQGVKRIVLQLPTGGGKTLISATIAQGAMAKGNRMAFVAPRIALIDQTVEEYWKEDIRDVGVIQANHSMTDWSKPIQVCSIDTIRSKGEFPDASIVVFDEGHVWHETHELWMKAKPDTIFIALTATPWTKGLGKHYQTLLIISTMKDLMDEGYLSQYRAFGVSAPDLSDIGMVAGDYNKGQLSEKMTGDRVLTADIVETWKKRHGKDRTLFFGVDRAHAKSVQERFNQSGVLCGYQDANTKDDERREIRRKFHTGEFPVVASVGTLTLGVDWDVRCISYGCPTKSEIKFVQAFGRGVRLAPPGADHKDHLIFLDHSGVISGKDGLGYPEHIVHDRLDDGSKKKSEERKAPLPRPCSECAYLKPPRTPVCPNCGHKAVMVNGVIEGEGELVELNPNGPARTQKRGAPAEATIQDKVSWFAQIKGYARDYQKSEGWCAHTFRDRFGVWPNDYRIRSVEAIRCQDDVYRWIKHRMIAFAKQKKAEQQAVTKQSMEDVSV